MFPLLSFTTCKLRELLTSVHLSTALLFVFVFITDGLISFLTLLVAKCLTASRWFAGKHTMLLNCSVNTQIIVQNYVLVHFSLKPVILG
jgi:hypothetical protein